MFTSLWQIVSCIIFFHYLFTKTKQKKTLSHSLVLKDKWECTKPKGANCVTCKVCKSSMFSWRSDTNLVGCVYVRVCESTKPMYSPQMNAFVSPRMREIQSILRVLIKSTHTYRKNALCASNLSVLLVLLLHAHSFSTSNLLCSHKDFYSASDEWHGIACDLTQCKKHKQYQLG